MRHRKKRTKFARRTAHRIRTLKGLATSVIMHQGIRTTHVKAKEARKVVENLITIAKRDSLEARRKAYTVLGDRGLVSKLFKEIAPLFAKKQGGYTRIIPFDFRKGDGASMVLLELTEKKPEEKAKKKLTKKQELPTKPEKAPPKPAPDIEPQVKEEKTVEDVRKEKPRDEQRKFTKQKGFLKRMGGFFRRKTNM